jgi:hypothetical protein
MMAKLTRLTHKIVIQLHLVAECCTVCSSHSRWPVQKLLDIPSYIHKCVVINSFMVLIQFILRQMKVKEGCFR